VHCTHEGFVAQGYPSDQFDDRDVLRFLEYFAWDNKHEAYRELGDDADLSSFRKAMWVRHPAYSSALEKKPHECR